MITWLIGIKNKSTKKRRRKLRLAKLSLILLSLSISSFGASKKPIPVLEVKKDTCCNIECLKDNFYGELRVRNLFLVVNKTSLELIEDTTKWPCSSTPTAVACQFVDKIQFKKSHWESIPCNQREELALHELGHSHGLPHKEGTIMQSALMGSVKYLANRRQLIDDLAKQLGAP